MSLLKISEAAKLADVPKSTVQYYLREGLIKPKKVTDSGYQLFDRDAVKRIKKLKKVSSKTLKDL